jgi:hypothetical protein
MALEKQLTERLSVVFYFESITLHPMGLLWFLYFPSKTE